MVRKQTESEDEKWESEAGKEAQKVEKRESYARFLNRGGPRAPGSKQVPQGSPGCLSGLVFVLTGVYESLEREQVSALVKKLGARVVTNVSRNTTHMVVGEQAGPSKLQKAALLRTKLISEDELLDLIREKSGKEEIAEKKNSSLKMRMDTTSENGSKNNLDSNFKTRPNTNMQTTLDKRLNPEETSLHPPLEENEWEEREKQPLVEREWEEREKRQLVNFMWREAGQLGLEVNISSDFYRKIHFSTCQEMY